MPSLKQCLLGISLIATIFASGAASAKTFCSMTLNSSDELETFRKNLDGKGFDFVELVPSSTDSQWFRRACDSGIKCDVLLISGHFGGLFFGQGTSSTIGLTEMEQASCNNSCPGILKNPKEVFLMGCNTLATQSKDHRTIDEYLNVLIEDGVPLDFAEQVVASRYSQQGFSLEKRFSAIFNNSTKLYGFSSTGPLGKYAAPRLSQYLKQVGSYETHLEKISAAPNTALQNQFSGVNFRETTPTKALDPAARGLFCALRSENPEEQTKALNQVVTENKVVSFFDSIAGEALDFQNTALNLLDGAVKQNLKSILSKISAGNKNLVTIQHEVIQVSRAVGLIDNKTKLEKVNALLEQAYNQELSYSKVSQICGILKKEPDLQNLSLDKIRELSERSAYFMLTLACYPTLTEDTKLFLVEKMYYPKKDYERTLALQILKPHWTKEDMPFISAGLSSKDLSLKMRLYLSARKILLPYRKTILSGEGLAACILKSEDLGGNSLGTNWGCLTENNSELTVDVCDHFASLNNEVENADNMRWYCWSKTKPRLSKQKPECYALANSMTILGNQMKQIWNCGHPAFFY